MYIEFSNFMTLNHWKPPLTSDSRVLAALQHHFTCDTCFLVHCTHFLFFARVENECVLKSATEDFLKTLRLIEMPESHRESLNSHVIPQMPKRWVRPRADCKTVHWCWQQAEKKKRSLNSTSCRLAKWRRKPQRPFCVTSTDLYEINNKAVLSKAA